MSSGKTGHEYFWLCRRILSDYRIPPQDYDDVLAEAVYLSFVVPYKFSFILARWACFPVAK